MPVARVRLPVNPSGAESLEAWRQAMGATYTLRLEARSTIWKYILLDDWQGHSPRILDQAGKVQFEEPETTVLENGAQALSIRSVQEIPLQELPSQRFHLQDAAVRSERGLNACLPVADPRHFNREAIRGQPVYISEIFYHH